MVRQHCLQGGSRVSIGQFAFLAQRHQSAQVPPACLILHQQGQHPHRHCFGKVLRRPQHWQSTPQNGLHAQLRPILRHIHGGKHITKLHHTSRRHAHFGKGLGQFFGWNHPLQQTKAAAARQVDETWCAHTPTLADNPCGTKRPARISSTRWQRAAKAGLCVTSTTAKPCSATS